MLNEVLERARQGRAEAEADLFELLTIPSVSATPERRADCRRAAEWLEARLRRAGMDVQGVDVVEGGHPVGVAEWLGPARGPALAGDGHYDGPPPGPPRGGLVPPVRAPAPP